MKKEINAKSIIEMLDSGFLDEIPITFDADRCIDEFLERFYNTLQEHLEKGEFFRKLDYLKMKRFLFTAYHNLVEMDHTISQGRVIKPYKKLLTIQKLYDELVNFIKKPMKLIFDKLFLSKQNEYQTIIEAIANLKSEIDYTTGRTQVLYGALERIKKDLSNAKNQEKENLENIYKKNNKEYVDLLYELSKLREKLIKLEKIKKNFENEHFNTFSELFKNKSEKLVKEILDLLNSISYEFDTILWDEAKNSEVVRKFFKEAKIEGSFSSKTYLKYYLKSLADASNQEINSLKELLTYLESVSQRNIIVVCNNSEDAEKYKILLESIDKDYVVVETTNKDKIVVEHKNRGLDFIVIDYELKGDNGLEVIKRFWSEFLGTKERVYVLLMFDTPNYQAINEAGRSGIRYFFLKSSSDDEFVSKVKSIL